MRRVVVGAVAVLALVAAVGLYSATRSDTSQANTVGDTVCPTDTSNQTAAQTVPSASLVPCVALFGGRWSVTSETFTDDGTTVSMVGDDAADVTWKVQLAQSCDVGSARENGRRDGATVHQRESQTSSSYTRLQYLVFDGGCVVSDLVMPLRYDRALISDDVDAALVLVPRAALNAEVEEQTDGNLRLDP